MFGQKGKSNKSETDNTTWENKPEGTIGRKKTKKILRQGEEYRQNKIFQSNKKILPANQGRMHKDILTFQQLDEKETKQFWNKIW